jgi:hypothetical protein
MSSQTRKRLSQPAKRLPANGLAAKWRKDRFTLAGRKMAMEMRQPCLSQRGIVSVGIVAVDQGSKHSRLEILADRPRPER